MTIRKMTRSFRFAGLFLPGARWGQPDPRGFPD